MLLRKGMVLRVRERSRCRSWTGNQGGPGFWRRDGQGRLRSSLMKREAMSSFLEGRKEEKRGRSLPRCHSTLRSADEVRGIAWGLFPGPGASVSPVMVLCGTYLLAGGSVFPVGARDVLRMWREGVRLLRAQRNPNGKRSHCGQWTGGLSAIVHWPYLEQDLASRYP